MFFCMLTLLAIFVPMIGMQEECDAHSLLLSKVVQSYALDKEISNKDGGRTHSLDYDATHNRLFAATTGGIVGWNCHDYMLCFSNKELKKATFLIVDSDTLYCAAQKPRTGIYAVDIPTNTYKQLSEMFTDVMAYDKVKKVLYAGKERAIEKIDMLNTTGCEEWPIDLGAAIGVTSVTSLCHNNKDNTLYVGLSCGYVQLRDCAASGACLKTLDLRLWSIKSLICDSQLDEVYIRKCPTDKPQLFQCNSALNNEKPIHYPYKIGSFAQDSASKLLCMRSGPKNIVHIVDPNNTCSRVTTLLDNSEVFTEFPIACDSQRSIFYAGGYEKISVLKPYIPFASISLDFHQNAYLIFKHFVMFRSDLFDFM